MPRTIRSAVIINKSRIVLTPEQFGAVGDGVTDDYAAWSALAAAASFHGREVIVNCRAGATYRLDREYRWALGFTVDTIRQRSGSSVLRIMRTTTNDTPDICWIQIKRLIVNGNGSKIVSKGDVHYTEADVVSSVNRQPKLNTIVPFFCVKCRYIELNDIEGDGEWRYATCSSIQVSASAVDTGANTITAPAHGLVTGEGLNMYSLAPPAPLANGVRYYIIRIDDDTIKLATTFALANAGTAADLTTQGAGTHTMKLAIGQRYSYGVRTIGCREIVMNNATFSNYMGDGFAPSPRYAAGYTFYEAVPDSDGVCERVTLTDCHFDNSGRQGISIIGCTDVFRMIRGTCDYAGFPGGSAGYDCPEGTSPGSGLDFEPDRFGKDLVGDVYMQDVSLVGNWGSPFILPWNAGRTLVNIRVFDDTDVDLVNHRLTIEGKATGVRSSTNIGNGLLTMGAPSVTGSPIIGMYLVEITNEVTDGGTFDVLDPNGDYVDSGAIGVEFADQVKFTWADGDSDFKIGDFATITVSALANNMPDLQRAPNCGHRVRLTSTGTLPAPLATGTDYYPFGRDSGSTYFRLATSLANAIAGVGISFVDGGTGAHSIFLHNTPSWGRSCRVVNPTMMHPAGTLALRGRSAFALQVASNNCSIEGGSFTIEDPLSAWTQTLIGDCAVHMTGLVISVVGIFVKQTLGTALVRNNYVYDNVVDDCDITYTGAVAIGLATSLNGIIKATYGDFSLMNSRIDFGANPHDGTGNDKVMNFTQAKEISGNTYETSYDPPSTQRLQLDYSGALIVSGETYNYSGVQNPYVTIGP